MIAVYFLLRKFGNDLKLALSRKCNFFSINIFRKK